MTDERWIGNECCICRKEGENMTEENGHVGPYDYVITYCLHHTDAELAVVYEDIWDSREKYTLKSLDEILASTAVDQRAMDKAKSVLAGMKYINTCLHKRLEK